MTSAGSGPTLPLAALPIASNLTAVNSEATINHSTDVLDSVKAALGRSLTRALALYFARPVRLFRPSKVTGWMTLNHAAQQQNMSISPQYLSLLIKTEGWKIIPHHFLPPLIVNSALGAILFESFILADRQLHRLYPNAPNVVLASAAGGFAGAMQAFAGAPADNVRLLLERGLSPSAQHGVHSGWRQAWVEVFRFTQHIDVAKVGGNKVISIIGPKTRKEAREVRKWMKEVKGMARGWDGVWWGVGKDTIGFAIFFAIFDVSRQLANSVAAYIDPTLALRELALATRPTSTEEERYDVSPTPRTRLTKARVGHGVVLVTGGVAAGLGYELASRPFENARRIVYEQRTNLDTPRSKDTFMGIMRVLTSHVGENGVVSLLRGSEAARHSSGSDVSPLYRRGIAFLRMLGRLGPWGIGFLIWEGLAPPD